MTIFVEPGEWAYVVLKLGRTRVGWYHGHYPLEGFRVWRVRG